MVLLSERINELFATSVDSLEDRISHYSVSFTTSKYPNIQELCDFITSINSRDKITITLNFESEDYLELDSKNLIEKSEEYIWYVTNEYETVVRIRIDKDIVDNTFSIYDFQSFSSWLFDKSDITALLSYNNILKNRTNIVGRIYDDEQIQIITPTIAFTTSEVVVTQNDFNRLSKLEITRGCVNFYNVDTFSFIPDDFNLINCSDERFRILFSRFNTYLSMIYLSNISSIDTSTNELHLQLQGKLAKTFTYSLDQNFKENRELFNIYSWVYSGDHYYDKLLIARNIITLHCRTTSFSEIDDKTYSSIISNYNLYLQKSVTDYLNLKNRLSEFLIDMNAKCSSLISQQVKHLTGNMVAFLSFISMVFLINIVSTTELDRVFTPDVAGICYLILIGSMIYCIVSYTCTKCQVSSIQTRYDSLRESYTSILEENDINAIFNNDDEFNLEKIRVERFSLRLLVLWIALIVIACIIIIILSHGVDVGCFAHILAESSVYERYFLK